ncbi:hypothetical protein [Flammeovirga sp. SJP92]|uniref:hypothetical protein n=1 Tax=Flammeovirga sp. SJP92 TaxID=1775430 RepID=UPI00078707DD|nr:hypothetical protein [Flammeovirga sp. SJP92]KXX67253.1 hypothetical protein AVL50_28105 [Flammeovirga sp. SJP92]
MSELTQQENKIHIQTTTKVSGNLEQLKSGLSNKAKSIKATEQKQVASTASSIPPTPQQPTPPPAPSFGSSKPKKSKAIVGQSFTLEQAKKIWTSFADEYRQNGKSKFASILLDENEITLDSQLNIIVEITNTIQNEHLNIVRPELLRQLRTELKNETIEISTKLIQIEESKEPKRLYSPQDKLQFLQEKYPALKTLQQKLGLDFD